MDNPGWHALHRAEKSAERYNSPHRGPDGRYTPIEHVLPMDDGYADNFVGGFTPRPAPSPSNDFQAFNQPLPEGLLHPSYDGRISPVPPPILPPRPSPVAPPTHHTPISPVSRTSSTSSNPMTYLSSMSAVERSINLRVVRMIPHLQFMVGPLLRFDTIEGGVWRGAALIVTVDAGSYYDPHPVLKYSYDPTIPSPVFRSPTVSPTLSPVTSPKSSHSRNSSYASINSLGGGNGRTHGLSDRGSYSDSNTAGNLSSWSASQEFPGHPGEHLHVKNVSGQEIWVYCGEGGTYTFWRFTIQIPLGPNEMKVAYSINNGPETEFWVPAKDQDMRSAAYSCNGFSAGINPDDFRGPGFQTGYDPVWTDLLKKHSQEPFHALIGGGDQLYCDGVTREPELQEWIKLQKPGLKKTFPMTAEILSAIDRYYFNHYCQTFRSGAFAKANSRIPMLNMCDDHDLIDGFGSYPDDLQLSPVFRTIGSRGYFFFLLFQCFINTELDGLDDTPQKHPFHSVIIGGPGPYVPFPSHSILSNMGPHVWMLMLDCRAERRIDQVCSDTEYRKVFERLRRIPHGVEHLIIQLGIPIAYPRMVFLENALESKMNPLLYFGRNGSLGMSGFVNKFNADAELLDDLNDHWTSKNHKRERNWFIRQLQTFAQERRIRISFVTGDVHCAAVGVLKTLNRNKKAPDIPPERDFRYMLDITTSAIVNTPPPNTVLTMVNSLATKTHKTMHEQETDEEMISLFNHEPDGSPAKGKYIIGRRNWCSVQLDQRTGHLIFDIRVERQKGVGETVGYTVSAPPPMWSSVRV